MTKPDSHAQKSLADGSLSSLTEGAEKVVENASDLYVEARALHAAGALSRALLLHQISLEECAKIDMLGAWATSILMGVQVDTKKLSRAFSNHQAKNHTNAYMLPAGKDEVTARREKRWDDARSAFKEQQRAFHENSNTAKNDALYVNMQNGTFSAPKEKVTAEMVEAIAERNEQFLAHANTMLRTLQRWRSEPDAARELLTRVKSLLPERSDSENVEEVMASLMDGLERRAREIGYFGSAEPPKE